MASSEFDYRRYLTLLAKHKRLFLLTALLVMTGAVVASYLLPKKYEAKSTVFIEKSVISELVKGIAITPSIEDKVKVLTYAITSRTLLVKVIEELDLNVKKSSDAQLEELLSDIRNSLDVKVKDKEGLFIISYKDKDSRVARDFVNTLVRRYIEENTSSKREDSYGAGKFLTEQLKSFREKLDKAEAEENRFKREKGALVGMDPGALQKEINDAQQRIDDIRIKRAQLETLLGNLKKATPLQSKLIALQKRLEELEAQYTDKYPEVIRIRADIDAVKSQMRGNAKVEGYDALEIEKVVAEIWALKQAEDNLRGTIATNRGFQHSIPAVHAQLEALEREKASQKALYDLLMARQGQSEVSQQMEVQDKSSTFRIVDPAVMPIKPVSPNRVRIILMGILGGIAAGVGLLMLMDFLDGSVKSVDALRGFGLPVLAVIPRIQEPLVLLSQRRRDLKLYGIAALYFCVILGFLAMEALDLPYVDKVIERVISLKG